MSEQNGARAGLQIDKDQVMLRKLIFAFSAGVIVLSAAACNTVKGAGRDIESVGEAGADAID